MVNAIASDMACAEQNFQHQLTTNGSGLITIVPRAASGQIMPRAHALGADAAAERVDVHDRLDLY